MPSAEEPLLAPDLAPEGPPPPSSKAKGRKVRVGVQDESAVAGEGCVGLRSDVLKTLLLLVFEHPLNLRTSMAVEVVVRPVRCKPLVHVAEVDAFGVKPGHFC